MTAISWGHGIEATAAQLTEESTKARENGERYAQMTAENAAADCRAPGAKSGIAANLSGAARASRVYMRENQRFAIQDVPARLAHAHQRRAVPRQLRPKVAGIPRERARFNDGAVQRGVFDSPTVRVLPKSF
jgi:hypothetical protein